MATPSIPAQPVFRTAEIREIEKRAIAGSNPPRLMDLAGHAAAELARELAGDRADILVLAGPGNNGGDAFVCARYLRQWWFSVTVVFAGRVEKLSTDAKQALDEWRAAGGDVVDALPARRDFGLVIDGLFGIGLERGLEGVYKALVESLNGLECPVLSIDIPSGLASDTGQVRGGAMRAGHTVTFIGLKPGLLTADGPEYCGRIHLRELGLDPEALVAPSVWRIGESAVSGFLPRRPFNSHKGLYGSVAILGGAPGMTGAALLAGRAALKLGAGRTYVGFIGPAPVVDTEQPELMLRPADEVMGLSNLSCIVAGPGLGQSVDACLHLDAALATGLPLVLDADALNLIAAFPDLQNRLKSRQEATLATPHPAEAARLLSTDTASIQADRLAAALDLARRFRICVALKGAGTVCALPDGRMFINSSGNPGMASAGMGDVLSGMLGAFLAQGLDAEHALLLGVYLHGAAADRAVAKEIGPVGLTASEVTEQARRLLNRWVYRTPS
ncbi:MAG: NAD(P)H-hydrate dehydratase [Betaproteobacteria bacterium]|nr:NAD(P)H-hydrate dehydratase [Betaproteobacteria bacterium]